MALRSFGLLLKRPNITSSFFSTSSIMQTKVAVILSGCGVNDGSEIFEATGIQVHLSRNNADITIFAPNTKQLHVIDHCKGEPVDGEARNVLVESARISRNGAQPLDQLDVSSFDAVVFPGGFGAAKNLSTFAMDGTSMTVNKDVEKVIKAFHDAKKPIGMCCISPILAAKVIKGCEVTLGSDDKNDERWPFSSACDAAKEFGAKHVNKEGQVHVDKKNLLVTTPAFMFGPSKLHEVFDGIGHMIKEVIDLAKK